MKKVVSLAMAALAVVAIAAPVFAADDAMDKVVQGALIPTRLGGVAAGVVVGTPIAIVRESVKSYKDLTEKCADKVGGHDFGPSCLLVSFATLPAGLVVGGVKGTYYGMKNGMVEGFQTPFAHDSFSLGKMEE